MSEVAALKKELKAEISAMTRKLQLVMLGGDLKGFVCDKVFMERTGIDNANKLAKFRSAHPELVKRKGDKFVYNLQGYFDLFE